MAPPPPGACVCARAWRRASCVESDDRAAHNGADAPAALLAVFTTVSTPATATAASKEWPP